MKDIKYIEEEIEEVKKYRKRTISEYHLYCDECKKEILDGNKYYEVNIYGDDISMPSEEKCLCKECTKEISRYFISNDYHEMDISKNVFSLDDHIGKSQKYMIVDLRA